jgi:DNA-binding NarL/FixJ family response regulator
MTEEPKYEQLQQRIKELEKASADADLVREALRQSEATLKRFTEAARKDFAVHERGNILPTTQTYAAMAKHDQDEISEPNIQSSHDRPQDVVFVAKDSTTKRDVTSSEDRRKKLRRTQDLQELRSAEYTREELQDKTENLQEVNTALKVLLKKRDADRTDFEDKVVANVKELVLPYIEKIKMRASQDTKLQAYLEVLESNLNSIISPFSHKLSSRFFSLTSTEIAVAKLVRQGKNTKQIADLLNASNKTVETHRLNIRKKLGLTNKKANLRTYLLSL